MNGIQPAQEDNVASAIACATCATMSTDKIHEAPEWIELLPAGIFNGRDGRGPFRLTNPEAVIAATDAQQMEAGLPIDYDHATDLAAPSGRRAPAAGWIRAIEVREGALWGKVEWTTHGSAAVVTHEYRYISPVFEYSQDGEVQRVLRAALTNNPNLHLTAISACTSNSNSIASAVSLQDEHAAVVDDTHRSYMADNIETQLRELLGLAPESGAELITDEVRRLLGLRTVASSTRDSTIETSGTHVGTHSIVVDPVRYVPIEQYTNTLTELNELRATTARERAAVRVDLAMKAGKITPSQREWAIAYCQADTSAFESFVARQPAFITGITKDFASALRDERHSKDARNGGNCENHRAAITLTRTELAVCAQLGLRPDDYMQRRGVRDELTS